MWRILWLLNLFVLSRSEISCDDAFKNCETDFGCSQILYQIFHAQVCRRALGCEPSPYFKITGPMEQKCPLTCVQAIKSLTSRPKGKALESCDCKSDAVCLTLKSRLQRCVLKSEGNYTIFSCTTARARCNNNTICKKVQRNFLRRCTHLISGSECTQDCKDSQDELLESELGKALNDCECDGREEPYCRGIRAHYERLCKATRDPRESDASVTPVEPTVMQRDYHRNSSANSQFGLPMWILYAAIIAHVYVAVCLSLH